MSEHDPTRNEREAAFRAALRYALAVASDDAMLEGLPDDYLADAGAAFARACRDYVCAVDRHPQAVQWPHRWEPDDAGKLRNQVADLTSENAWLRAAVERNDRVIAVFVDHHCQHPLPEDVRRRVVAAMDGTSVDEVTD